tara:strand:+ start:88 stop:477 length:390 start_codon:yes stop_codon:yes gene_type:complete
MGFKMKIENIKKRLKKIESILNNNNGIMENSLYQERNELEFKLNKENINIRLTCNNKYYYANQCKKFTDLILKKGFPYIDKKEIKANGISFNKYSINIGHNQYYNDLKRFNSKDEMLGFVIGYNAANGV